MESTRQYYKSDPRAPRFIRGSYNILNETFFYRKLKKQYPELAIYSNAQIAKFIYNYNKRIAKEVIDNRNGIKLPDGLGVIVAGACGVSKETAAKNINWHEFKKTGVPVVHQNTNTENLVVRIKYTNVLDRHMFDNRQMWCFDADRTLAKAVSIEFRKPDGWKKYLRFTTRQHMAHLFRKHKIKNTKKKEYTRRDLLESYDEFAFN